MFSSFRGTGAIQPGELIFDFDPNASVEGIGMRLLLPDGTQIRSDVTFSLDAKNQRIRSLGPPAFVTWPDAACDTIFLMT